MLHRPLLQQLPGLQPAEWDRHVSNRLPGGVAMADVVQQQASQHGANEKTSRDAVARC